MLLAIFQMLDNHFIPAVRNKTHYLITYLERWYRSPDKVFTLNHMVVYAIPIALPSLYNFEDGVFERISLEMS